MYCTGGTTGRPKGVLWRQSDTYVSSMVGADHESATEIHDKVRAQRGRAVVRRLAADARRRAVDRLLGNAGRAARGALRRPDQVQPARRLADRRAREGRPHDHGRRRLRRATGRGTQRRRSYELSSLYAIGTGGAATNPKHVSALLEKLPQLDDHQRLRIVGDRQHGLRPQPAWIAPRHVRPARRAARWCPRTSRASCRPGMPRSDGWCEPGGSRWGTSTTPKPPARPSPWSRASGWWSPGTARRLEADGTLRLFGRDSLVVNTGGEKVFVEEVEAVLRAQAGVADALVVGRDSERWGQEVVALVEPHPGATVDPDALHAACVEQLARFKAPKEFIVVDKVRRLGNGKADYRWAKSTRRAAAADDGHDAQTGRSTASSTSTSARPRSSPSSCSRCATTTSRVRSRCTTRSSCPQLLDEMDEHGVAKAILMDNLVKPSVTARKFVEERPDRFALAVGGDQPAASGACACANWRRCTATCPWRMPLWGRASGATGMYPPSDAVYYPLYAKCAELELPLCVNTGLPGPPIPGEVQNPIHLDRVCVRFPELKLCMIHGADPWWDVAIRLLIKYENLRIMTSAWSPKRLPDSLLHYMRTRGKNKVIFASDWPVLRQSRVVPEALALDLPADVLDNYLYNNAEEFFFGAASRKDVTMDRYELRREDYSLSEDQIDLQQAYQKFFKANCSIEVVRAAEAVGFDKSLWERLCATGATTMALPESVGGDGATPGRPDAGRRGDSAGQHRAGAVDRSRVRRAAAGPAGSARRRQPDRHRRADRRPGRAGRRYERHPADPGRIHRRPHRPARRRRRRTPDVRHQACPGGQHRKAADGVGGSRRRGHQNRARQRTRRAGELCTGP